MEKSNFRDWTLAKIDTVFGLEQIEQMPELDAWLSFAHTHTDYQKQLLKDLQETIELGIDGWNEAEIRNKLINPLIVFTKIDNRKFCYFLNRSLSHTLGNYELTGIVDGMIASGFREPDHPFFCLNEYKKEHDNAGDPAGQALIAMMVAQEYTNNDHPIYGCYVVGRYWYFMVLKDQKYAISNTYVATHDSEILDIFRIMLGLKFIINQRLGLL